MRQEDKLLRHYKDEVRPMTLEEDHIKEIFIQPAPNGVCRNNPYVHRNYYDKHIKYFTFIEHHLP